MSIRILLADDHTILLHGLGHSIEQQDDMEVVGLAQDGIQVIELVRKQLPDIVIMDIEMPSMNGIEATREIVQDFPTVKIIALSMHSTKKFVSEMFKAGATGYLLKDCDFDEFKLAIQTVISGKTYLNPSITNVVVDNYISSTDPSAPSVFVKLTPREREVLQLTAEGHTTKQTGLKLHISPKTVESHRLRIMDKLQLDNVARLTKYAIQEGLTSAQP
jgi:two-component system, NarL family, response regulator NreC